MRILQIIDSLVVGGAQDVATNLAIGFKKSGHESRILLLKNESFKKNRDRLRIALVKVKHLNCPIYSISSILEVEKVIRDFQPDIIQTHLSGFFYFLSNLRLKKPIVHTVHNLYLADTGPKGRLFNKLMLRYASACVAVSMAAEQSNIKFHNLKNTYVIKDGINIYDQSAFKNSSLGTIGKKLARKMVLINVANLIPTKNHELLIKSFAIAKKKISHIKLIIAGDGRLKNKLKSLIRSLGLENEVFLLGHRSDIQQLLSVSDIFVLSSNVEGLCLSLLEAMERNLPVISTKVGGVVEIVSNGKNGIFAESNEQSVSKAIVKLANDAVLRKKLGQNGRKMVKSKYSVDIMVSKYLKLYSELLIKRQ